MGEIMKVIITAGGTGGHIYPALSIINKIKEKEPQSEFIYIGTHNRMEKDIVPKYNIEYIPLEIYGLSKKDIKRDIKNIFLIKKAYKKCIKVMKDFKPDIVIGVGGYVTYPVILAAHKLNIKTFIHEQNSIPGKCNLFLSKYVSKIGVSLKSSIKYFPEYKCVFTGNPCSEDAINKPAQKKEEFGLNPNKKLALFVMGSLGSTKINDILIKAMNLFKNKNYEILFVTGKNSYEEIKKIKFSSNVKVVPYIENMTRIMKNTDIIISRAGASTLSEIIALKIPSILIPSPYVPDNHQYKNALDLSSNNAAILIEEKDLNGNILVKTIDEILNDEEKIKDMKKNLEKLYVPKSATKIYETIRNIIDGK